MKRWQLTKPNLMRLIGNAITSRINPIAGADKPKLSAPGSRIERFTAVDPLRTITREVWTHPTKGRRHRRVSEQLL